MNTKKTPKIKYPYLPKIEKKVFSKKKKLKEFKICIPNTKGNSFFKIFL